VDENRWTKIVGQKSLDKNLRKFAQSADQNRQLRKMVYDGSVGQSVVIVKYEHC
jgi:hypothetical protein